MRRVAIATLTILALLATLVAGQLALVSPSKALAAAPPGSYSVKDFGAKGDGTTNDTNAIQVAMDSLPTGGVLYFPAGTYIVKAKAAGTFSILKLKTSSVKLVGYSVSDCIVKTADDCPTYQCILGGATISTNLSGLEIYNLTFDHNIDNNPVANERETDDYPEASVTIGSGSNVYIHDIEIKNANSRQNINIYGGPGVTDYATVENVTCSNIGDDPNHIRHDASFIYIHGNNYSITGCTLSAKYFNCPGGTAATEVHGSNGLVQDNTITNFRCGCNLTGVDYYDDTNLTFTENVITNCCIGVYIWSNAYKTHTSGYGIDGAVVSQNNITVAPVGVGDNLIRGGVIVENTADLDINNMTIEHNTITYTLETSPVGHSTSGFGIGWRATVPTPPTLHNSTIRNNNIVNSDMAGIRFSGINIDTVTVQNNTLANCGSTKASVADAYKTPVSIAGISISGLKVSNNTFKDTIPVTRIPYFMYLTGTVNSTGVTVNNNSFSITGNKAGFVKHIYVGDVLFFIAVIHAGGSISLRKYSPGLVAGLCLYVPLTIWAFTSYNRFKKSIAKTAVLFSIALHSIPLLAFAIRTALMKATNEEG